MRESVFQVTASSIFSYFAIGFFILSAQGLSKEPSQDITIGKKVVISSKILGEDRPLFISIPQGYHLGGNAYPVLYILDGGGSFLFATSVTDFMARNGLIPSMIVVAIPNTNRNRDFTPTVEKDRENSGGAPKFLEFMEKELIPFVENNYHTQSYRILSGHSLCGMFSIYTMAVKPELFNATIAMSPYLMYDNETVIETASNGIDKKSLNGKSLFITLGNEPNYNASLNRFTKLLKKQTSKEFSWKFERMNAEGHGSIPLKSLYAGLEFIFDDWKLKGEVFNAGLSAIERHYQNINKKYGYSIEIPEPILNRLGYQYLQNSNIKEAVKVFMENVKRYPLSANVYDSLGEALEKQGKSKEALKNYQKAVELGEKTQSPNLKVFRQNADRLIIKKES